MLGITGASGFLGSSIASYFEHQKIPIRRMLRKGFDLPANGVVVGDIGPNTKWREKIEGLSTLIHCAAMVHAPSNSGETEYQNTNHFGTVRLAEEAALQGVRRFVFISTIKVLGESTKIGHPFFYNDTPHPVGHYAVSKRDAEIGLMRLAETSDMEVVIIRPPLIYGPGVGANFGRLIKLISLGIPLPFRSIDNKRSYVGIDNLLNFVSVCVSHPRAAGEIFLVSDGEDVSTPDLVYKIGSAIESKTSQFSTPIPLLCTLGTFAGRYSEIRRLTDSLQVDIQYNYSRLGWRPPLSLDRSLQNALK